MSESTELLSAIVEFSIGLAGFSGVIGIFINRAGQWIYVDRFRITNLLLMSLTPGFLSFFTLGLLQISSHAIEISGAIFTLSLALFLVFIPRARSKVHERDRHLVGPHIFVPMASLFALIMVTQALVAMSVINNYEFTIYYFSLVVMLLLAVVQFARLILARPDVPTDQRGSEL